ncbi:hypothetical protein [Deinococcus arenicola]|uniref:DUF2399 domain-containing protein n=1 Tax=Deinococcus arenicola TaxID=2994950 RepID=A0ABU4DVI5_9DEIO|nr:hypothetical protein [Deinococcus sp. ZS9-10]MDV6376461.1 hypothetical protein [Deinococcus sp. ZS9-10]
MSRIEYVPKRFSAEHRAIIAEANTIIEEYEAQGYDLTLRQLYYQFVSRALIPNTQQSYKRLGTIISDARLAGEVSWDAISDRTRNLKGGGGWESPEDIIRAVARQYKRQMWEDQPCYAEVWVEKEALANVVERISDKYGVPWFCCRGYVSQSEMHSAAKRLESRVDRGQQVHVIHLGDHDPSGIDMTRDIEDRIGMFITGNPEWRKEGFDPCFTLSRIALSMEQVRQYRPPPNPAKTTDARYAGYEAEYGDKSWELDALDPSTLSSLIEAAISPLIDHEKWEANETAQANEKQALLTLSRTWKTVYPTLRGQA